MSTTSVLLGARQSGGAGSLSGWGGNLAGVLGLALLSAVVSAVVAAVALGFSGAGGEQFGWEWAALWAVSLVTIVVTARATFGLANFVAPALVRGWERRRRTREDQRFMDYARMDSRIMSEIDSAVRRSEWL